MLPVLSEAAREVGYALAIHGTLGRDMDVVAIPWTEEAVSAEALIMRLLSAMGHRGVSLSHRRGSQDVPPTVSGGDIPDRKPHGRLAWSLHFESEMYIDISVMPRVTP
jgi:hypothetical protein